MIAHIFKGMGRKVGMTSTDGVVIDERLVIRADASGPKSARMVLQNPRVDFAVFEVARGGILREGLGYERNDVAVVLNVQPDHLGLRGVDTVEQLADVKAVPVEAVPRDGHAVLNADDPLVRAMRRRCSGQVVWFSMEPVGSEIRDFIDIHCRRGGKAVVLESSDKGEMIVVRHGNRQMQLAWTHLLPATFGGRALMNVQNSLAAAAAAFAAGAPLHDIRQGLRTFSTNYYLSPGRLNQLEVEGVNVVVDYCHNAPGMRALGDFVDKLGDSLLATSDLGKPSRIGVVATAGDRRDEDLLDLGRVAADHFDVIVVREDAGAARSAAWGDSRPGGRRVSANGSASGARCKQVELVLDEIGAVRHAMSRANKGDLVILCVDKHAAVLAELESWSNQAQAGASSSPRSRPATLTSRARSHSGVSSSVLTGASDGARNRRRPMNSDDRDRSVSTTGFRSTQVWWRPAHDDIEGVHMLDSSKAFSGFAVKDVDEAERFYTRHPRASDVRQRTRDAAPADRRRGGSLGLPQSRPRAGHLHGAELPGLRCRGGGRGPRRSGGRVSPVRRLRPGRLGDLPWRRAADRLVRGPVGQRVLGGRCRVSPRPRTDRSWGSGLLPLRCQFGRK